MSCEVLGCYLVHFDESQVVVIACPALVLPVVRVDHHSLHQQVPGLGVIKGPVCGTEENRNPIGQFLRIHPMARLRFLAEYLVEAPLSLGTVRELKY